MTASIRTCIGCRQRDAAADMVRLWADGIDGRIAVAEARRSGRGASIHARPACLEKGLRPDVLARAFKRRVTLTDAADLLQLIITASRRKR
jgi:uncharacterized protein